MLSSYLNDIVPFWLADDRRLKAADVRVYLWLSHTYLQRGHDPSVNSLANASPISYETFRRSIHRLADCGWVAIREADRHLTVHPSMPVELEQHIADQLIRLRDEVPFVGEWLLKCKLDAVVRDQDYGDNLRPRWLVSPEGGGRLELDRLYRKAKVAFEFQGRQHYQPSSEFHKGDDDFQRQIERDQLKDALCNTEGIRLITVQAKDLPFPQLLEKVAGVLPLRPINEDRPIYRALEKLTRSYLNYTSRGSGGGVSS